MTQVIPKTRLTRWARRRYRGQGSTVDLIASVQSIADKSAIAIVALLEVEPQLRYQGMCGAELQYTQSCHTYLTALRNEWESQ